VAALALVAGCSPAPMHQPGTDMTGSPDQFSGTTADMPRAQCTWSVSWSGVVSAGSSAVDSIVIVDRAQCVYASDVIELKTARGDGSIDDLTLNLQGVAIGHALELVSYPGAPLYRLIASGQAIPTITCTKWSGAAVLDAAPPHVHFDVTCTSGWDPLVVDMRAPDVHLVGSISID
jgi:hypothetical protein